MNTTPKQPISVHDAREEVANWLAALKLGAVGSTLTPAAKQGYLLDLTLYNAALKGSAPEDTVNRAMAVVTALKAVS